MCIIEHCRLTETPNVFKVPKKIPEEKVPVPVQKKEAPPARGTLSLLNPKSFNRSSLSCVLCPCVLLFGVRCPGLLLVVVNIKNVSLKCPKYQRKFQKRRKSPKRKSLCPKRKLPPLLKVFSGKFFDLHVLS